MELNNFNNCAWFPQEAVIHFLSQDRFTCNKFQFKGATQFDHLDYDLWDYQLSDSERNFYNLYKKQNVYFYASYSDEGAQSYRLENFVKDDNIAVINKDGIPCILHVEDANINSTESKVGWIYAQIITMEDFLEPFFICKQNIKPNLEIFLPRDLTGICVEYTGPRFT